MEIDIKIVENGDEFQTCISIRRQVFILGQNISADIEMDDDHIDATHVLATIADEPVGTARWRNIDFGVKLERFAVVEDYRNFGVGKALVLFVLNALKNEKFIYLNAQESVICFYEKLGFTPFGDRFIEAEIPHQKMVYSG